MNTNKQQSTTRPSWREREVQKERQRREDVAQAADDAQRKKITKTETNFPTTMKPTQKMTVHGGTAGKFAELATKWQVEEEISRQLESYRRANNERERGMILDTVISLRNRRTRNDSYESEDEEERVVETPDEKFPSHGPRGTFTPPDNEGWRLVTRKTRRQPRELTQAQLAQKYRDEFYGGDAEEEAEVNDDYDDRAQRRQFY
jgi:hypothetical protein